MTEPASRQLPPVPPVPPTPAASPAPPPPPARHAPALWLTTTLRVPLYRNGAALVLNSGVTALLGLVYWLLAAHDYSAHAVGVNTAAISAMMFLAGVAQLNLMSALVRFVPILRGARGRFIAVCYATAAAAAIACAAVFLVGIGTWAPALGVLGSGPAMVGWFIGATVIWCVFNLQDSAMTGLDAAVLVPAENTVYGVAKIVLLVALASVSPALGIFASWTAGLLFSIVPVNLAIFTMLLRRRVPEPDAAVKVPTPKEILHFVAPDYLAALLWLAATTLMPVIVVAVAGATSNAYFSLAWMIILPIGAVSASMGVALVATASAEPHRLPEYARSTMRRTARLVTPAALFVAIASPWVVRLFGRQYAAHAPLTLSLLALSVIPGMVTALYTSIYRVQRRMRRVVAIQAGLCISVLILGPVLLTAMGPAGVGLAWLVCQSAVATIILSLDPVALGTQPSRIRRGGRHLAARATARVPLVRRVAQRHLYPLARCVPPGMQLTSIEAITDVVVGVARASRTEAGDGATVYLKLALTPRGDESLERARRQLLGLANDPRLRDWEIAVPRVLDHGRLRGRLYIVETGLAGVPMAQVLAGGAPSRALATRAIAAVDGLHGRTAETTSAPPSLLDHWVGEPARALEDLVSRSPRRVRALRELSANLASALDGQRVRTSWTHGDFVPGNVLIGSAGQVTGIIDWEMGSTPDLPAVDRMMLLLAMHTQLERVQLGSLVSAIARRRAPAPLWSGLDVVARTGAGQPLDVRALALLCWLRHAAAHATFRERSTRLAVWRHNNVDPVLDAWRPR